jgi:predicted ATPase
METKNMLQFIHDRPGSFKHSRSGRDSPADRHHLLGGSEGRRYGEIENLFTIVSPQFGKEENPIQAAWRLSDVHYHAGKRALDSLATEAADEYFSLSRELLPSDCWQALRYERTFRIYQKAAKTALMCGNYGNSKRLLTKLLDHAKTDLTANAWQSRQPHCLHRHGQHRNDNRWSASARPSRMIRRRPTAEEKN